MNTCPEKTNLNRWTIGHCGAINVVFSNLAQHTIWALVVALVPYSWMTWWHFLFSLSVAKDKKTIIRILKIYSILLIPIFFVLIFIGNQVQFESLNQILNNKFGVTVHPQLGGGFYWVLGNFYVWHYYYFTYISGFSFV